MKRVLLLALVLQTSALFGQVGSHLELAGGGAPRGIAIRNPFYTPPMVHFNFELDFGGAFLFPAHVLAEANGLNIFWIRTGPLLTGDYQAGATFDSGGRLSVTTTGGDCSDAQPCSYEGHTLSASWTCEEILRANGATRYVYTLQALTIGTLTDGQGVVTDGVRGQFRQSTNSETHRFDPTSLSMTPGALALDLQ